MAKKYIKVYFDLLDALEPFGDAERGRLFTAMLEYGRSGAISGLSGNERFLFPMIRAQLDRDKINYEAQCQINFENGKKGGAPQGNSNAAQKQAEISEIWETTGINQKQPEQAKQPKSRQDKEKDKEKEKKNSPHIPPKGDVGVISDGFERFWAAYPRKKAKSNALKAFQKLEPDSALLGRILRALEVQKASQDWQRDAGRYIPYPATWLNGMRWEDETVPQRRSADTGPNSSIDMEKLHEMLHRDSM